MVNLFYLASISLQANRYRPQESTWKHSQRSGGAAYIEGFDFNSAPITRNRKNAGVSVAVGWIEEEEHCKKLIDLLEEMAKVSFCRGVPRALETRLPAQSCLL
jgi:hypothetical protein